MYVDNVRIPWVKSSSLICSDLLQRIFVCCPCLTCLHSPCWFTCCWHISSKWHPNWCLQVAGPSVTRLSTPHAYTHAQTYIHHTFSARQWWGNFIYILHLALGDFVNMQECVGARWVTRTVFAKAYALRFPFGIPDIRGSPFLQWRIWLITAGN